MATTASYGRLTDLIQVSAGRGTATVLAPVQVRLAAVSACQDQP